LPWSLGLKINATINANNEGPEVVLLTDTVKRKRGGVGNIEFDVRRKLGNHWRI